MEDNGIMPLKPIDYSKTIMYHIYSESCDFVYVGHTINTTRRKAEHKRHCEKEHDPKYNFPIYNQIRENGGWDNFIFAEIEEYPCENAVQARIREQYWIEHYKANLNSMKEYRSPEERKEYENQHGKQYYEANKEHIKGKTKQHYEANKEHIKEKTKQHYEANKERILEQHKQHYEVNKEIILQKMTCECGSEICVVVKARHYRSKKHIQYMESKA
jgi:hypothetical protein